MAFVIDRSLYLSPEVVGEPLRYAPLEVKEDPFSLEALVAWLEKQPGGTEYCYTKPSQCLVAQAFGLVGLFSEEIDAKCFPGAGDIAADHPWTFGAALSGARKLLAEREK